MSATRPGRADQPREMALSEHLDELRRRIIYGLIGVGVTVVIALIYGRDLVLLIQLPLFQVQDFLGQPRSAYFFSPVAAFSIYLKVSIVAGLLLAIPWLFYQLWKFISEGLLPHEKRVVYVLAPLSSLMLVLGVLFAYFVMVPVCLLFLLGWAHTYPEPGAGSSVLERMIDTAGRPGVLDLPERREAEIADPGEDEPLFRIPLMAHDPAAPEEGQMWVKIPEGELRIFAGGRVNVYQAPRQGAMETFLGVDSIINLSLMLMLGIAIGFQLPVVLLVLGWVGLVDPAWLRRYRKYALFICFALGALLTPADPLSMIILAVPLYGLFELGLVLMHFFYRKRSGAEPSREEG